VRKATQDEEPLPAGSFGEAARRGVGEGLGDAEGDNERQDRRLGGKTEVLFADKREHAPLEADHCADESVEPDQQSELVHIRPKA
jgi:hypothetical protein